MATATAAAAATGSNIKAPITHPARWPGALLHYHGFLSSVQARTCPRSRPRIQGRTRVQVQVTNPLHAARCSPRSAVLHGTSQLIDSTRNPKSRSFTPRKLGRVWNGQQPATASFLLFWAEFLRLPSLIRFVMLLPASGASISPPAPLPARVPTLIVPENLPGSWWACFLSISLGSRRRAPWAFRQNGTFSRGGTSAQVESASWTASVAEVRQLVVRADVQVSVADGLPGRQSQAHRATASGLLEIYTLGPTAVGDHGARRSSSTDVCCDSGALRKPVFRTDHDGRYGASAAVNYQRRSPC
ncbi:hypothetical protein CSOJ01_08124 [Colletotrichum sojae]|uniref:Uncharacterized protein n=1 Tax=Colletotrichum sojae TaxID=2175907 RepID=A0A8H6J6N8_9PEZI|nr:hypothetical protein CSOJ01_08124 [Colletotrichum sojae]